jgi:N-hydroxyarylamine O-acetyltransferase
VLRAIAPELQAAYLGRLGVEAEPPSIDALQRMHRRHVERIPYETMWIHAGEKWDADPAASVERIALHGRGGYCYHLNGAFSELLFSLGYTVTRHVGGVHGPGGPDADAVGNHLVLMVSGLTSDGNPSGVWYVDVGLGDALHEAIPLTAGAYQQGPFRLVLTNAGDPGDSGWHLAHDPDGGFTGMSWTMGTATMDRFTEKHQWLSTSPESGFVRIAMAQTRDTNGVDVVRGLIVKRIGKSAFTGQPLTERREWFDALADLFGLRFDHSSPESLDRLWNRSLETHRAWEASGQP